jgi:hypothetical protein
MFKVLYAAFLATCVTFLTAFAALSSADCGSDAISKGNYKPAGCDRAIKLNPNDTRLLQSRKRLR